MHRLRRGAANPLRRRWSAQDQPVCDRAACRHRRRWSYVHRDGPESGHRASHGCLGAARRLVALPKRLLEREPLAHQALRLVGDEGRRRVRETQQPLVVAPQIGLQPFVLQAKAPRLLARRRTPARQRHPVLLPPGLRPVMSRCGDGLSDQKLDVSRGCERARAAVERTRGKMRFLLGSLEVIQQCKRRRMGRHFHSCRVDRLLRQLQAGLDLVAFQDGCVERGECGLDAIVDR
mmetsp:Transcript_19199/g.47770  ORF Transcript_19199/g.47770 Transcript_19199/m.47770 type:complete len:234 (+) Transcript_19199:124-825(+)